ncbi:hypothetical protein C2G38_2038624 [Gigaspora rosea]|uniref:Uncharacterized protein n=1 Tax=Gigaspora rosea TaxID=44941 RepID=A0A397V648_9GLOM|nr:hypothetical protein C2G38_2038624 [Gigaspora rosea]CAG8462716.1 2650_t:CDS:1 [Gigaspora rosea]
MSDDFDGIDLNRSEMIGNKVVENELNIKKESNIRINLMKGNGVFAVNNKGTENSPESDKMVTLKSTLINIDQDCRTNDPEYYCKNEMVNVVNTDKETVDKVKMHELLENLEDEGIEIDEVNVVESCRKSVEEDNVSGLCSKKHCDDKESSIKVYDLNEEKDTKDNSADVDEVDMDEEKMVGSNLKSVKEGKAVVESKEKDNRLVFDPGKIIEDNGATADLSYDEVDVESMLVKYSEDNAVVGLDEYAGKIGGKDSDLNVQNNANMDRRIEIVNISKLGSKKHYDETRKMAFNEYDNIPVESDSKSGLGDATENVIESDNLNYCMKNNDKMKTVNDGKRYVPVISDSDDVIDSNRSKDNEWKSLVIESDPKVAPHNKEAMMKKMHDKEFEGRGDMDEVVKGLVKVLMKDKINEKTEIISIPEIGFKKYNDQMTKNESISKEWSDLACRYRYDEIGSKIGAVEELDRSGCEMDGFREEAAKVLMKNKRLNNVDNHIREIDIKEHDVPTIGVEDDNYGDKAPDGRAESHSIDKYNIARKDKKL